jgi:hypothetical protein
LTPEGYRTAPFSPRGGPISISDRIAPLAVSGISVITERPCLFVSVTGSVQLLDTLSRVEMRQEFKDGGGNIAGQDYHRFAPVHLAREEERGGSQLGRLLVEWLWPTEAVRAEEIGGLFGEFIGAFQRKTCHIYGSQPRGRGTV